MRIFLRRSVLVFALIATLAISFVCPLRAQTHPNFVHRHPTATAVAAGAGTTYLLKKSAKYKREHGGHLSLAERHPYISGMGAAVVTHHMLKKHN
jgi:hypothetical protein